MYLKSIEVQGFKSFANKIKFEFHDGITGIVGPNGSGKSNVADAVRWVLGEQSAKQLRGANMQDVIFAGTEARKPLGFAYVAITMDNADHKLPIDYDEVTVARRVYRSGESEYMINGSSCRLRDVQDLFLDTGVGKEGYSIIGQGQIDKILSGKPEERRELFDEAAGIVKFKKRKALSEKNLEEERSNLARISDIVAEIEKQLGPLEKQSTVAREYLRLRDELKITEINQFLYDYENVKNSSLQLEKKNEIVSSDLNNTKLEYDKIKDDYEKLEKQLEDCSTELETRHNENSEILVAIQKAEGDIKVLDEQLTGILQNESHYQERIDAIQKSIDNKNNELAVQLTKKNENEIKLNNLYESQNEISEELQKLKKRIEERVSNMADFNNDIFKFLNKNTDIKTTIQRLETLHEQTTIKKAEITQNMLNSKHDEAVVKNELEESTDKLKEASDRIINKSSEIEKIEQSIQKLGGTIKELDEEFITKQQEFMTEQSKLESLKNLAERYDGYGISIKKIMEQKVNDKGIIGVVADIISVEKKYETAVETALGNSIQNIVTEDEGTAKKLIEFLKKNKFGRATFIPLTSITYSKGDERKAENEKGVLGTAADIVNADYKFYDMIQYLLGRILVVDTMDNALAIAKKYKYSLKIVTLEGEQLAPGGSISGGAYKNTSSLLGRKREIDEREEKLNELKSEVDDLQKQKDTERQNRTSLRENLENEQHNLQDLFVEQNTAKMKLNQVELKHNEIIAEYQEHAHLLHEAEEKLQEYNDEIDAQNAELKQNAEMSKENEARIEQYTQLLEEEQRFEKEMSEQAATLRLEVSNGENTQSFIEQNIERINNEINSFNDDIAGLTVSTLDFEEQKKQREDSICNNKQLINDAKEQLILCEKAIKVLNDEKDNITKTHKNFFGRREELSSRISELDKEAFRISNQRDKLEEIQNNNISHIWDEYELTPTSAAEFKNSNYENQNKNKKAIADLRVQIKALGDVNVNAIQDYKEISERYNFLSGQRNDIKAAEETLVNIIAELDKAMREQFEREFAKINTQFDIVFKELFGGGKGTLELTEEENVLEAGIRIIAQPLGKKLQNMMQLSGGEKALTAIALLFAIQNLKPSPFCLVDEIEAALDDSNVKRFAKYLTKLTRETQFIVITHRRGTMAAADRLYGITMQEKGVSALVSVNLIEGELDK